MAIKSPMRIENYWTTADANLRHVYHDVLIALDETCGINNGQPSLWAKLYDELNMRTDMHVVHVGAGVGYYTAILAEIVGPSGRVTAIEVDPQLAGRARENLSRPQEPSLSPMALLSERIRRLTPLSSMQGSVTSQ